MIHPSRTRGPLVAGLLALALAVGAPSAADDDPLDPGAVPDEAPALLTSPEIVAALASRATALRRVYAGPREQWPPPQVDEGVPWTELGPAPQAVVDSSDTPARQALGKTLFFDPRLSRSGQIACASCHDPDLAWADGRTTSFGHDRLALRRNSPSLLFAGNRQVFFWDGRAYSLEEQAWQVLGNKDEMHESVEDAAAVVSSIPGYAPLFAAAYDDGAVTGDRIVGAIATFERTIVGGRSAFDQFLRGESSALDDDAVRGLHVFRTRGRCMSCHHGPLLTDDLFHDVGLSYYGRELQDLGRYAVTKDPADVGRFRTPTLRDVARTAPYTHLGLFDMKGLLSLYNVGMPTLRRRPDQQDDPLFPTKSPVLHKLDLSPRDLADLEAFMNALTEPRRRVRPPPLPR
jgi:cytochrome c peroxidase